MRVSDLLEIIRADLLDDTEGGGDGSAYAWSDDQLVRWIGDAQRQACRRQDLRHLYDDTFTIRLKDGVPAYELDSCILRLDEVRFGATILTHTTLANLDAYCPTWRDYDDGEPQRFYVRGHKLFLDRSPSSHEDGDSLNLVIWREPLGDPSLHDDLEWLLDQEKLGHWVAHKAFARRDEDTEDKKRSQEHRELFDLAFGPEVPARVRQELLQYPDNAVNFAPSVRQATLTDDFDRW